MAEYQPTTEAEVESLGVVGKAEVALVHIQGALTQNHGHAQNPIQGQDLGHGLHTEVDGEHPVEGGIAVLAVQVLRLVCHMKNCPTNPAKGKVAVEAVEEGEDEEKVELLIILQIKTDPTKIPCLVHLQARNRQPRIKTKMSGKEKKNFLSFLRRICHTQKRSC